LPFCCAALRATARIRIARSASSTSIGIESGSAISSLTARSSARCGSRSRISAPPFNISASTSPAA
jgi:hypothetical protein